MEDFFKNLKDDPNLKKESMPEPPAPPKIKEDNLIIRNLEEDALTLLITPETPKFKEDSKRVRNFAENTPVILTIPDPLKVTEGNIIRNLEATKDLFPAPDPDKVKEGDKIRNLGETTKEFVATPETPKVEDDNVTIQPLEELGTNNKNTESTVLSKPSSPEPQEEAPAPRYPYGTDTFFATPISGPAKDDVVLHNLEENVRRTIAKLETNEMVDVDEISTKLNELSDQKNEPIKEPQSKSELLLDKAKASFSILTKSNEPPQPEPKDDPFKEPYENDNVLAFLN